MFVFSALGIESRDALIALIAELKRPVEKLSVVESIKNTKVGYLIV